MSARFSFIVLALLPLCVGQAPAADRANYQSLRGGIGIVANPSTRTECGVELLNADGSFESAYQSQYGAVAPPYYGAFAECYTGPAEICGITLYLTYTGCQEVFPLDAYVWDDSDGIPGSVIFMRNFNTGMPAFWPSLHRNLIDVGPICMEEIYWIGVWGEWPGSSSCWYFGADLDGPGGCPKTNVAPGIEYPPGWQDVSLVFGPTAAMGLGAVVRPCQPVPANNTSWGLIKGLFR